MRTCGDVATYTNWWWCEESAEWFVECKEDGHPWKQTQRFALSARGHGQRTIAQGTSTYIISVMQSIRHM
jgi:hypothetical protein